MSEVVAGIAFDATVRTPTRGPGATFDGVASRGWITSAKEAETRSTRVAKAITMVRQGLALS
ncbi:MAG TPA: YdeI/OmpD-associated family protein [Acidimicrobiales bacterium]|nr:YdeI/OmpD-associated family protein [Acidimicrobiales bacterium]